MELHDHAQDIKIVAVIVEGVLSCIISINPNAHSTREIDLTHCGVEILFVALRRFSTVSIATCGAIGERILILDGSLLRALLLVEPSWEMPFSSQPP
jgi:hypothetical protein